MRSIIFDLDLTLVDTTILEPYRHNRDWNGAYAHISECVLYDGIIEVFNLIKKHNIKCCIVSTSPRTYVEKIVEYFDIPVTGIVGYHDAKPIKPAPAPMIKALEILGSTPENTISFGDRAIDIVSSNSAGIESVACFWGTKERSELVKSGYRHAIINPSEIITLIR